MIQIIVCGAGSALHGNLVGLCVPTLTGCQDQHAQPKLEGKQEGKNPAK